MYTHSLGFKQNEFRCTSFINPSLHRLLLSTESNSLHKNGFTNDLHRINLPLPFLSSFPPVFVNACLIKRLHKTYYDTIFTYLLRSLWHTFFVQLHWAINIFHLCPTQEDPGGEGHWRWGVWEEQNLHHPPGGAGAAGDRAETWSVHLRLTPTPVLY